MSCTGLQRQKILSSTIKQQDYTLALDIKMSISPVSPYFVFYRFGFDVPVILRSSDEADSLSSAPEKRMVQVTNPFSLELGTTTASVTGRCHR